MDVRQYVTYIFVVYLYYSYQYSFMLLSVSISLQIPATYFNKANAKNTQLYKYNNTNEVFYIKIPSSWTDIFPISSKYADILLEKLCSYIWRLLYVSKQGAHYFYKLLVKMMEELEFSVTQFNKVVFYDFSKTVPSKFKVRSKGKKRQKNFK